ncbi:hypothetical protein FUAX_32470 [Fulvitalea axinellae]|uniref:Uncharacterized protein n=1 Tax=Fulvitalea axinellae TaxID=1182444 RepID=A0AAU9DEA9_9BACT|nr:hypothetical protein FUAX_32470 [Fulvitalea axinellae]
MKRLLIPLLLFILINYTWCPAQITGKGISYIAFRLDHSMRIPNHSVTVEIINRRKDVEVNVISIPKTDDIIWQQTAVDTTFNISKKKFETIANKVRTLRGVDLEKSIVTGLDGYRSSIEFGSYQNKITYTFWSPNLNTKERGLSDFLNLCKDIIKVGKLRRNEVL